MGGIVSDFDALAVAKKWNALLEAYMKPHLAKALFQLISTGLLFAVAWYLMLRLTDNHYWAALLLSIPAAGLLVRLFIFQHDCGHGSFFKSKRLNDDVGFVIGILTMTPHPYWKRAHAIHHGTSGDLDRRLFGEIATLTVSEYNDLSKWRRLRYRAYRHPITLLVIGPAYQFLLKHRLPLDIPRTWKKEWRGILWTNLAIAGVIALAWGTIGIKRFVMIQLPITLISGSMGVWLFYVQHQFEDTYWREHTEWDFHRAGIEGSSFYDLPQVLHWFTGNIGFHHVHHLASRIPNYQLKRCYREVADLHRVTRLTLWRSFHCARLKLWDEASNKLISFRQLRTQMA